MSEELKLSKLSQQKLKIKNRKDGDRRSEGRIDY